MSDRAAQPPNANRWRRFADWDERPLRLDRFAVEDPQNGFAAFTSAKDPKPGLEIAGGRVASMDGVAVGRFRHDRPSSSPTITSISSSRRSDGGALAADRAHAGRHQRAARPSWRASPMA